MKPAQVNKLYKQLTPTELANLAIEALTRLDSDEISLIVDSVERVTYQCTHSEYRRRLMGFECLALFYGVEYWKNHALLVMAAHADEDMSNSVTLLRLFSTKLCSLEQALIETCAKSQFNIEAVKWLAECNGLPPPSGSTHPDWLTHYNDLFAACLPMR